MKENEKEVGEIRNNERKSKEKGKGMKNYAKDIPFSGHNLHLLLSLVHRPFTAQRSSKKTGQKKARYVSYVQQKGKEMILLV